MKYLFKTIFSVAMMIILISCTKRIYIPEKTVTTKTEILRDTIMYVQLPNDSSSIVSFSDSSFLENDFACSHVKIDSNGLHHTLYAKKDSLPFHVVYRDREIVRDSVVWVNIKGDTVYRETVPKWCWWFIGITLIIVAGKILQITKLFYK